MKHVLALLALLIFLSGCSRFAVHRYAVSADNAVALRSLQGKTLAVGPFTSRGPDLHAMMCRAVGPIQTPDGETYADFMRKALIDELRMANAYAPEAPIVLTGNLNTIDFSSISGAWELSLTVSSSNGRSLTIAEKYDFPNSFFLGDSACQQAAQALRPALQNLIGQAVQSAAFMALVSSEAGLIRQGPLASAPLVALPPSSDPPALVATPATFPMPGPRVPVNSPAAALVVPTAAEPPAPVAGEPRILQLLLQYNPAPLLRTPNLEALKVGTVGSGATVHILEERDAWLFVQTRMGERGWLAKAWLRR